MGICSEQLGVPLAGLLLFVSDISPNKEVEIVQAQHCIKVNSPSDQGVNNQWQSPRAVLVFFGGRRGRRRRRRGRGRRRRRKRDLSTLIMLKPSHLWNTLKCYF